MTPSASFKVDDNASVVKFQNTFSRLCETTKRNDLAVFYAKRRHVLSWAEDRSRNR